MSKYKFRLVEQEEAGAEETPNAKQRIVYDLVLTPLTGTIENVVSAFENIDNYGSYISNIRNTREDIEKAISTYFGPNQRFDKMGIEKAFKASGGNFETFKDFLSKGKQIKFLDVAEDMFKTLTNNKGLFHVKTKPAIDAYIKSLSGKPSLLKWEVVSDTLVFPSAGNPTKKMTEKIISTVMLNAGIAYELVSKEAVSESFRSFIMEQLNKLFK